MKLRSVLLILISVIYPLISTAQTEDPAKDKRALLRLCRSLLKDSVREIDNGNYDSALGLLDSVLQCDSDNADAFYHKARILSWSGDTSSARAVLSDGVEKAPRSTRLRLLFSRILIDEKAFEEASGHIDNVLAIKPREGEALYLKGLILMAQDDTLGAAEVFEKALDISLKRKKR